MLRLRKDIKPFEDVPFWYGLAYSEPWKGSFVFYPVPLNWLVRWSLGFMYFLKVPQRKTKLEKAFEAGVTEGKKRERRMILNGNQRVH